MKNPVPTLTSARIFKVLGSEVRLRITQALTHNGEVSCRQLRQLFPLAQSTMSLHFGKLVDAGIIRVRQEGARHYYSLDQRLLRRHGITLK